MWFVVLLLMLSVPHHLHNVSVYTPGASPEQIREQFGLRDVEKLASNENPLGPSRKALEAAQQALLGTNIYGDGGKALCDVLAAKHGVHADNIVVNNGSDAIIHQIVRTFLGKDHVAMSSAGTFISFALAVRALGFSPLLVPASATHGFDVEAIAAAITPNVQILYIANPNNPTGTHITSEEFHWLMERVPASTLVVMDEAYVEYAQDLAPETYPDCHAAGYKNILQLRTFSKAYGLAGLRVGYALGDTTSIHWLQRTKLPFDPNVVACAAAIAALQDTEHLHATVELNSQGIRQLQLAATQAGFETTHSVANFITLVCKNRSVATHVHHSLLQNGFITRHLVGFDLPNMVRISTGTHEQNNRLASILQTLEIQERTLQQQ